jgi:hypothetical protein
MTLEDKATLWNKFNSSPNSEIGADGTWVGTPLYADAKFDKGARNLVVANYLTFPESVLDRNEFIFSCWQKSEGWNAVDGKPDDAATHALFGWHLSGTDFIQCYYNPSVGLRQHFRISGADVLIDCTDPVLAFNDGGLHHILIAYKQSGIDGGPDILRSYFDGVMACSSSSAPLSQGGSGGLFYHNIISLNFPWVGTLDNTKMFKPVDSATIAEVLTNRFTEGLDPEPVILHAMPKVEFDNRNSNTGAWYHQTVNLTTGTYSDAYLFPVYGVQRIGAVVDGDGYLEFTNDEPAVIEAGLATWVAWDGVSPINNAYRAFRVQRTSGTVTGKVTIKTGTA